MIDPHELHELIRGIVDHVTSDVTSDTEKRDAVVLFASDHGLSTQRTAALLRVAAGEGVFSPVVQWTVVP